jgi:hypothetical protein
MNTKTMIVAASLAAVALAAITPGASASTIVDCAENSAPFPGQTHPMLHCVSDCTILNYSEDFPADHHIGLDPANPDNPASCEHHG